MTWREAKSQIALFPLRKPDVLERYARSFALERSPLDRQFVELDLLSPFGRLGDSHGALLALKLATNRKISQAPHSLLYPTACWFGSCKMTNMSFLGADLPGARRLKRPTCSPFLHNVIHGRAGGTVARATPPFWKCSNLESHLTHNKKIKLANRRGQGIENIYHLFFQTEAYYLPPNQRHRSYNKLSEQSCGTYGKDISLNLPSV